MLLPHRGRRQLKRSLFWSPTSHLQLPPDTPSPTMNGTNTSFFGLVRRATRSYFVYPCRRNCEGSNMPNYTGRQRKLSDAEIIERYRQGHGAETVGIAAGCSGSTVLAIVRAAGETVRQRGEGSTGKKIRLIFTDIVAIPARCRDLLFGTTFLYLIHVALPHCRFREHWSGICKYTS